MSEPVYACSLTDAELAARRGEWKEVARDLVRSESLVGGRLLVYRGGEDMVQVLGSLIEAESRCCPFLDFSVERRAGEVHVIINFPPQAEPEVIEIARR
jgi:hypothetical protein